MIIFLLIVLSFLSYILYFLYKRRKAINSLPESESVPDEIVKINMGKHTIYLRNCEIENFNSQPRKMRLHIAKEFERKIKKGILIPVKEGEKILGFITRKEAKQKGVI